MSKDQIKILKFILPTTLILSIAFYINSKQYTLYIAATLILVSLVAPFIILKIVDTLEFISPFISKAIYIPLLSISFFLLILPIGLLRKIIGRDNINNKKFHKDIKSNFDITELEYTSDDLTHPF
ncbi:MAG: hypothetical protein ACJAZU_001663 [Bacteriovoracaceae bacterium]|jgi:hypothetical protein